MKDIKKKAKMIGEGYKNLIFKKELVEKIATHRRSICDECPFISTKHKTDRPDVHCTICGCPLAAKLRSLDEMNQCPDTPPRWTSIFKNNQNGTEPE